MGYMGMNGRIILNWILKNKVMLTSLFIYYLFIYVLFSNAVSMSDYTVLNGIMTDEYE